MAFESGTVSVGVSTRKSDFDQLLDNTQWNKGRLDTVYSGTTAFVGAKTFTDIQTSTFSIHPKLPGIDSNTSTSGVSIQAGYDISGTISLKRLYKKIIEIGDWDIDTGQLNEISHGIADHNKIRTVQVIIRSDADTVNHPLDYDPGDGAEGWWRIDENDIHMYALPSGIFNLGGYSSTSFNRGWITIEYEE